MIMRTLAWMAHANIEAYSSTLLGADARSSKVTPNDRASCRRGHASHESKMAATAIQIGFAPSMPPKPQAKTSASAIKPLSFRGFKRVESIREEAGVQT